MKRCLKDRFEAAFFTEMTFEELKDKALSLPLEPGVYLMQDKSGQIIYVGDRKSVGRERV